MLTHKNDQEIRPSRVVILGAGGFVGRNLKFFLEEKQIPCFAITRENTDLMSPESIDYLSKVLKKDDSLVFLSALTPDRGKGIDTFLHNLQMGKNVFDALSKSPVNHVVYLSSDAVYSFNSHLIDEESPADPIDLYGLMHRSRELMVQSLNIPNTVIRSTMVYGFGDTHNSYGSNRFLKQAIQTKEISLFGDGEETRSHIYIDDLIELIVNCLVKKTTGILNACSFPSYTFFEVAEKIIGKLGYGTIKTNPRASEITHRHFNINKVLSVFPEFQFTSIDQGLGSTIKKLQESSATN